MDFKAKNFLLTKAFEFECFELLRMDQPFSPRGPGNPLGPTGPGAPVKPISPFSPVKPMSPFSPGAPILKIVLNG